MKRALVTGIAFAMAALAAAPSASARESLTPNDASFDPPQMVGTTGAPRPFTLRVSCQEDPANPGTCQATTPFTPEFAVTGDFVLVSENCPPTLPGDTFFGTTCEIQVAFAPKSVGDRGGRLNTGSPFAVAVLRGQGSPPFVIITPGLPTEPSPKPAKCKKAKKHAGTAAKKCRKAKKKKR